MPDYTLKSGDTYPALVATLSDANGPVDLTAADSVRFIMKNDATVVDGACTVDDASNGVVSYDWAPGDTATPGEYQAEFEVTWNVGEIETYPNDGYKSISVVADLD